MMATINPVELVWPPEGPQRSEIDFDVVFFHGLQFGDDAHKMWRSTWSLQDDPEICWPVEWLAPDLGPNARILFLSYDAHATTLHGLGTTDDVSEIAKTLVESVVTSTKWKLGQEHPFVLVGHSFGAIVIKSLVVEVKRISTLRLSNASPLDKKHIKDAKAFMKTMVGVVFYAAPHAGSQQLIEYVKRQYGGLASKLEQWDNVKAKILENIDPSDSKSATLASKFDSARRLPWTSVFGFVETMGVDKEVGMIVEKGATPMLGPYNLYSVEGANHFQVCKPANTEDMRYQQLLQFLCGCRDNFRLQTWKNLPTLPSAVIGLDEMVEKVLTRLGNDNVHVLGVVGMGGIGKTTLVKKLFCQIQGEFQKAIFLENVKSMALQHVQEQLLNYLCGLEWEDTESFRQYIKKCWKEKRVLVVMDDVSGTQSINELLSIDLDIVKTNANGSKVILTSCNWQDLKNVVCKDGKFEMELLKKEHAIALFSMKAFPQSSPPNQLESVVNKVVNACNGLPLSLEVMGSRLSGIDSLEVWEECLIRLQEAKSMGGGKENEKLWSQLRVSVEDLDSEEKDMFLDIACFFSEGPMEGNFCKFVLMVDIRLGMEVKKVLKIWNATSRSSPMIGLQNLKD